eukprot:CAMPEP_0182884592 /NCGR_PEP_ID=MMETSP0034_2-20130328/19092_1 /TAXON_ID=156128 /ORGANISM="Nephroselmis pyriformis, Strain CCMP717" /LENGTH=133 /DNA_ID=CAMNT_0025017799 /DNA_START=384 /DNA_END=783 /DNA_ORIENTATION=+
MRGALYSHSKYLGSSTWKPPVWERPSARMFHWSTESVFAPAIPPPAASMTFLRMRGPMASALTKPPRNRVPLFKARHANAFAPLSGTVDPGGASSARGVASGMKHHGAPPCTRKTYSCDAPPSAFCSSEENLQ